MKNRFGIIVMIAVIASSTLVAALNPYVVKAEGEGGPYPSEDMVSISKKYASQEALLGCFLAVAKEYGGSGGPYYVPPTRTTYSHEQVSAGKFFQHTNRSFPEVVVGYVIGGGGDDGRVNCTDQDGTAEGQSLNWLRDLGWDDPFEAICEMNADPGIIGGPRGQIESCMKNKTNDVAIFRLPSYDKILSAIRAKNIGVATNFPGGVEAGKEYSLTDPARYITDWAALNSSCSLSDAVEVAGKDKPGVTKEGGTNINTDNRLVLAVVNQNSSISYVSYRYDMERSGINVFALTKERSSGKGFTENCSKVAEDLNNYAGAYAKYLTAYRKVVGEGGMRRGELGSSSGGAGKPEAVCAGGVLGWVMCPLVTLMSGAIDVFIGLIEEYLRFDPLLGTKSGDAVLSAWRIVVGVANVALVLVFLVVIFSQATSVGLSAYGVKKILPRIIAAGILINISFYLCAILVDVFNIFGASVAGIAGNAMSAIPNEGAVKQLMDPTSPEFIVRTIATWWASMQALLSVVAIGAITGTIGYIVPFLLGIVLAFFLIFLVLAVRHTLAILLVIISPLAFAAMVLPGTESLFKKWWKALLTTLALYPIIMALAYGSMLVSKIMMTQIDNPNSVSGAFGVLMAMFVTVAWIFALKFIVSWGSGLVGKIGGIVNDKTKGLVDRSRNWAKEKKDRSTYQTMKTMRKNAGNTAAQRRAITRLGDKSLWGGIARRGAYGIMGNKNSPFKLQNEANQLLGTQAEKAMSGIQREQRETMAEHVNRPTMDLVGRGFRLNDTNDGFIHKSGQQFTFDQISNKAHMKAAGIAGVDKEVVARDALDPATISNMAYMRDNKVMDSLNGIKMVTERAFHTGAMDSKMLDDLVARVEKPAEKSELVEYANQTAMEKGYVHMGFNSYDPSTNKIIRGGRLGGMKLVTEKMLKKFGEISKDAWADKDNLDWAREVHEYITTNTSPEQFKSEIAKMDTQQAEKFLGIMNAGQQQLTGTDWKSKSAFMADRDVAIKEYRKA